MVKPTSEQNFAAGGRKQLSRDLLAALVLAAQALAAPGVSVLPTMTSSHPGGFIFDGTRCGYRTRSQGLCAWSRGGGGGFRFGTASSPRRTTSACQAIVGQPAYDPATGFVYLAGHEHGQQRDLAVPL